FTRMRRCAAAADDLVQETFLRLHRSRSSFALGARLVPWVYTIARNVLIDEGRSARLRGGQAISGEEIVELPDTGGAAVSVAAAAETAQAVERALRRIPPSQRQAFELLRCEGLSVKDAAGTLGTTAAATKLRAFRAAEAIRAELSC